MNQQAPQPVTRPMLEMVWWALFAGVLMMAVVIIFGIAPSGKEAPAWADWLVAAGLVASAPAWLYSQRVRERAVRPTFSAIGSEQVAPEVVRRMFIGCVLAELPLAFGVAHYLLTGNRFGIGLLTGVTLGLLALFRPSTMLRT